jgi:nucleoside-diphosphate-sugar epimerase/spore maturation protein CgeB
MKLAIFGLSLGSSWGNGHATTYRALLKAFAARGHEIDFYEREVPWYAGEHRDLVDPDFCRLVYYRDIADLETWSARIAAADAVILGSYVPDAPELSAWLDQHTTGVRALYDIDTPVTLANLERGNTDYLTPEMIAGCDLYLSFTGGPTLRKLEQVYQAPRASALYCSVDADAYRPLDVAPKWDLTYLGTYSPDRQGSLERLLIRPARQRPDKSFAVAGAQYPDDIAWPANVERIEHLAPPDHPSFYSASRLTLNLTRQDMIAAGWSPSVRLFEAAACATPIVSDIWDGLDKLFRPDREILLAERTEDILAMLDGDHTELGQAGRCRVLNEHTSAHRAAELERELARAADRRPAPIHGSKTMAAEPPLTLVAGGAGFIGSHLCEALLARGERVVCLDNLQTSRPSNLDQLDRHPRFDFVRGDITEPLPEAITARTKQFTRIYNLACAASPPHYQADPEHTMLTCVVGSDHLLRLAEESGARFLLTSTSEVYGDPECHPQREDYRGFVNCTGPRACYDEGKRAAEAIAFDFARLGRADVRVARIFNTYGPQMNPDDGRVVSNLICQALSGEDISIYGDGTQTRSFCYVADLVRGLIALMDCEECGFEPVNLGNPTELTVNELLEEILTITGINARVTHRPLPVDDPRRRRPDITRARELLGWSPEIGLREGLVDTCRWFARELAAADWNEEPRLVYAAE